MSTAVDKILLTNCILTRIDAIFFHVDITILIDALFFHVDITMLINMASSRCSAGLEPCRAVPESCCVSRAVPEPCRSRADGVAALGLELKRPCRRRSGAGVLLLLGGGRPVRGSTSTRT